MGWLKLNASKRMNPYTRKGKKANRQLQFNRAIAFVEYLERHEQLQSWEHLSRRQIIRFYKHMDEKGSAHKTIKAHYYAIRKLVEAVGRDDIAVPLPRDCEPTTGRK